MNYPEYSHWRRRLEADAPLPGGFQAAVTQCEFVPAEKPGVGVQIMNLALIRTEAPTDSFAGVFTKNALPGWPVVVSRAMMDTPRIRGVLVNNKIANVGAEGGRADSEALSRRVAEIFGDSDPYFPSSTGVIGWKLPLSEMNRAIPRLQTAVNRQTILPFAEAIMTTDAWPKIRSANCGHGRILGTAKGAGMVEPDMATMLAFILTDVAVGRDDCRRILPRIVNNSFNRISVDGETSTSDTVLLVSSGQKPYPGDREFIRSLSRVAGALAEDVVRNGEGCAHVFRVTVSGTEDESAAVYLARSIANAPLTKTAVRGNDPNVGRILQALGAACARRNQPIDPDRLVLEIAGRRVFENGRFRLEGPEEEALSRYFKERELPLPSPSPKWPRHEKTVEIAVFLKPGGKSASVVGSDLSEEYVTINADYRT